MLEIFLLMVLGKAQVIIGKAWHWALVFALLSSVLSGFALLVLLIKMLIAWGYFALLRRWQDNIAAWFAVFLLFPLALFALAWGLSGA